MGQTSPSILRTACNSRSWDRDRGCGVARAWGTIGKEDPGSWLARAVRVGEGGCWSPGVLESRSPGVPPGPGKGSPQTRHRPHTPSEPHFSGTLPLSAFSAGFSGLSQSAFPLAPPKPPLGLSEDGPAQGTAGLVTWGCSYGACTVHAPAQPDPPGGSPLTVRNNVDPTSKISLLGCVC